MLWLSTRWRHIITEITISISPQSSNLGNAPKWRGKDEEFVAQAYFFKARCLHQVSSNWIKLRKWKASIDFRGCEDVKESGKPVYLQQNTIISDWNSALTIPFWSRHLNSSAEITMTYWRVLKSGLSYIIPLIIEIPVTREKGTIVDFSISKSLSP